MKYVAGGTVLSSAGKYEGVRGIDTCVVEDKAVERSRKASSTR